MRLTSTSVLTATAALLPLVAVVAPLGTAPLLVVAALAVAATRGYEGEGFDVFRSPPSILLGLLVLWAAVTLVWSPEAAHGLQTVGKLTFTFAGGLILIDSARKLTHPERLACGRVLMIGVAVAVVYLAIDMYGNGVLRGTIQQAVGLRKFEPYMLNRGMTVIVLILWPALAVLGQLYGPRAMWLGLAAAVVLLAGSESATALVGLAAGTIIFVLAAVPGVTPALRVVTTMGAVLSVFALPLLAGSADRVESWRVDSPLQNSIIHRVFIWDFVASRAAEKPWVGWGFESSRSLGQDRQNHELLPGETPLDARKRNFRAYNLPLHPHNGGLQVWVELGAVGALLFAGIAGWLFWTAGDRTRWSSASGPLLAHVVTGYAIASSSYGIWQSWWMSSLWLSAVLAVAVVPLAADRANGP